MVSASMFELQGERQDRPDAWLYGAAALTVCYILFSITFLGVKELSRGGFVFAIIALAWALAAIAVGRFKFPKSLFFALAFYLYICFSGFFIDQYPLEYVGILATAWIGAISIGIFVANGVSINLVIVMFLINFFVNVAVIFSGYDARIVNVDVEKTFDDVQRFTGLIGQANKFLATVVVLPFFYFLSRTGITKKHFIMLLAILLAIVFLSGSRSGIVFFAVFAFFGIMLLEKHRLLVFVGCFVSVVFLGIASMAIDLQDTDALLYNIEKTELGEVTIIKRTIAALEGVDGSDDIRKELRTDFWPLFYERPILGYGPEQFKNLGIAGFDGYAHNNVAEIAINWGLVGLLVYYAMILASVLAILHGPPHKFKLLVIPVVLCLADIWFVTFLSRPFVLLLCLTLVASFPSVMKRSSGRRSMWSKRSRGRRRRSMRSEHSLGRRSTRSVDL